MAKNSEKKYHNETNVKKTPGAELTGKQRLKV